MTTHPNSTEAPSGHEIPEGAPAIVAVYVTGHADRFLPTLRSIFAHVPLPVVLGAPEASLLDIFGDLHLSQQVAASPAAFVNDLWSQWGVSILLITDAVVLPEGFLDTALGLVAADVRVGTVSFFSNAADFLSFPYPFQPTVRVVEGHDETSVTRKLRTRVPAPTPAPIPFATGAAVLLGAGALGAVGALRDCPTGAPVGTIADFSLRGRRRGFVDLLDAGTLYARPADIATEPMDSSLTLPDAEWLVAEHPFTAGFIERETSAPESPLVLAATTARAKVLGSRVLIDGYCLGPQEMGTQVSVLALIAALTERDDIAEVCVALGGDVPAYAVTVLAHPKVRARRCPPSELPSVFGYLDVAHRAYQPDHLFDAAAWRAAASRVVITVLDLIGYQIGSYHSSASDWVRYRDALRSSVATADAVTVISHDVRTQARLERMPVEDDRLFVVTYGTEHMTGDETARIPDELLDRGYVAGSFLLTLGTNYSHKNRDLAVQAHRVLRQRGWDLSLVLAGAFVPFGSSRVDESFSAHDDHDLFVLPDVSSEERNWLLRHASVVLYPTSAEGFGFVPFEAARNGTPTVNVAFGPVQELAGDVPVVAENWTPAALADAAERLLRDPALSQAQIDACLSAGTNYTWPLAAEQLTAVYRSVLARPRRCHAAPTP